MHLTLLTVSLRHLIKPRHNTSAESCLYMGITSNIHSVMKTRKTKKCQVRRIKTIAQIVHADKFE